MGKDLRDCMDLGGANHSALGIHSHNPSAPAPCGVCLYTPHSQGGAIVQSNTANLRILAQARELGEQTFHCKEQQKGEVANAQTTPAQDSQESTQTPHRGNDKKAKYFAMIFAFLGAGSEELPQAVMTKLPASKSAKRAQKTSLDSIAKEIKCTHKTYATHLPPMSSPPCKTKQRRKKA